MTLEEWSRLIGKPLPRQRKDGRWELRLTQKRRPGSGTPTTSSRASIYAKTLDELARSIRPDLKQQSEPTLNWEGRSLGKWVASEFLPLYKEGRRARSTTANAILFTGKLLDYKTPDGFLSDLPPRSLTIGTLVQAYTQATRGLADNTKRTLALVWIRVLTLLAEAEQLSPHLPNRFRREVAPPPYERSDRSPSPVEVMKVVKANEGRPVAAILYAGLMLGADRTEAATTPRAGLLKGEARLKGTKNKYRNRVVPLPDELRDKLLSMCGSKYLGEVATGVPMTNGTSKHLYDAFARAEMVRPATTKRKGTKRTRHQPDPNPFTFKSVRHTFTGIEHELGCPSAVRVAIMGHSPNSIDQAYQHPSDETIKRWLLAWSRHVDTLVEGSEKGSNSEEASETPSGSN